MATSSKTPFSTDKPVNDSSWIVSWWHALYHPSLTTYEKFAHDRGASTQRAFLWVGAGALIGSLLVWVNDFERVRVSPQYSTASLLLQFVFITLLWYAVVTVVAQAAARMFGGKGAYPQLAYAIAAFQAPLAIIRGAFFYSYFVSIALGVYSIVLTVIAVRAVHQVTLAKAVLVTALAIASVVVLSAVSSFLGFF